MHNGSAQLSSQGFEVPEQGGHRPNRQSSGFMGFRLPLRLRTPKNLLTNTTPGLLHFNGPSHEAAILHVRAKALRTRPSPSGRRVAHLFPYDEYAVPGPAQPAFGHFEQLSLQSVLRRCCTCAASCST